MEDVNCHGDSHTTMEDFAKAIQAVQGPYRDGILTKPEGWKYAPLTQPAYWYDTTLPVAVHRFDFKKLLKPVCAPLATIAGVFVTTERRHRIQ